MSGRLHRPDLDGLRGIAVLAVLFFHFDLLGMRGGFTGVDIFFVLSGFLMTQMLMSERFDWSLPGIGRFYRKRLWRIAPAYYVVLLGVAGFILFTGWPFGLGTFWKVLLQSATFSLNIFAPSDSGYFAGSAHLKPLLHTWSLGVEMQFYLIWPLICLGLLKLSPKGRVIAMGAIILLSLVASAILTVKDANVAYYSLPTRLWQFALGGLIAITPLTVIDGLSRRAVLLGQLFSAAAIVTVLFLAKGQPWPREVALLLCLATVFLMASSHKEGALVSAMLSLRPLRFLGEISYSAYLVHWPIAVFAYTIMADYSENALIRFVFLIASFTLAWALYVMIEQPFRKCGKRSFALREVALPATLLSLVALGALVFSSPAYLAYFVPQTSMQISDLDKEYRAFKQSCNRTGCLIGDVSGLAPSVAIWGDSHARHFGLGLDGVLKSQGKAMVLQTRSACPSYAPEFRASRFDEKCQQQAEKTLSWLENEQTIDQVVLASRWDMYLRGAEQLLFKNSLAALVEKLGAAGKKVVLVPQVPLAGSASERCKFTLSGSVANCFLARKSAADSQAEERSILSALAANYEHVWLFDPFDSLCNEEACALFRDGQFIYRDGNHLYSNGSRIIADDLLPFLGV
ncbi:acyltransferase [Rhodobacteraceae bacterium RKSG542]|uniref:acyltransferase family protein n=1 Tax=Pseudovibrio flavus TaxID=2529854 RepID=UPI0012BC458D|nr:acyltransferase family protein [Pseudovibrio flavus]MTI16175.1 acyltransferase [Pseudovibrio flavus]